METPDQLQQEIVSIQARNKKVTLDKEREESTTRKICIALLTYGVIVVFFKIVHIANPWVNALVPTMGFLLSTLSLNAMKHIWAKWIRKHE